MASSLISPHSCTLLHPPSSWYRYIVIYVRAIVSVYIFETWLSYNVYNNFSSLAFAFPGVNNSLFKKISSLLSILLNTPSQSLPRLFISPLNTFKHISVLLVPSQRLAQGLWPVLVGTGCLYWCTDVPRCSSTITKAFLCFS